ncbi:MAG: sugar ABC transporter permease [Candidatus Eremiobacteraeota bacterium]|nr:sugar ABC transporter permease [Candidatus Eremiobacteraeota bacterium]
MNRKKEIKNLLTGLGFLAPNILEFIVFMLIPVIVAFVLSFHRWDMFSSPEFVGLKNYKLLLRDPWFQKSLLNTFFFVIVSVPISIVLSFFPSIFLNEKLRGIVIFRTIYFLPVVASLIAVALVWR